MTGTASELYHQTMISVGMLPTLLRWRCCRGQCDQRTGDCYIWRPLWTFIKYGDHNVWCAVNTSEKYGSADAQSGLAGAASQPGTSATWQAQRPAGQLSQACHADMHATARRLTLFCVNCTALRQRPNNLCEFSWYVMDNGRGEEQNIAITDVRAPDGASVYLTTWDETAPRPHRTPSSRRGITTYAMQWGPWSRVTEHSTALETGTPVTSFRQGQRGTPHHGRKNGETPFRSEVSLALFKIVFCR